ncbi:MAG: hypothetical protein STSR0008_12470 [Ignavibacterium sp.]
MKKIITLILALFISEIFPQDMNRPSVERENEQFKLPGFYYGILIVPEDSLNDFYFYYKVANQSLVFEKGKNNFESNYRIMLETFDDLTKYTHRDFIYDTIKVNNYEDTRVQNIFYEGMIKFKVPNSLLKINLSFNDLVASKEYLFNDIKLDLKEIKSKKILEPILVNNKKILCNNDSLNSIANYSKFIPFNENSYDLIIPVIDTSTESINVEVLGTITKNKYEVKDYFIAKLKIDTCNGQNFLTFSKDNFYITKNFIVRNFTDKYYDESIKITIKNPLDEKSEQSFNKIIYWENRPLSLLNIEFAIKALGSIEKYEVVDSLLTAKTNTSVEKLFNYWKKYDPDTNTIYNELMTEFYRRVDYAVQNFSSFGANDGHFTDRGKIYVKYGKPSFINRSSSVSGEMTEVWTYKNLNRKFIFIDEKNSGKFTLKNIL